MSPSRLWTKEFVLICVTNFLVFTGYYYMLVTMPAFSIQQFPEHASQAGLMNTFFLIAAILIRPLAGKWSERVGMYVVLISALAVLFGGSVFYFLPHSFLALLLLRFFHGLGFGMSSGSAGTIVANIVPESRKGEGMGYFGLTLNIAMVVGPFLGLTVMREWGGWSMFAVVGLCFLLALLSGLSVALPRVRQFPAPSPTQGKTGLRLKELFEVSALPISVVMALFSLVYSSIVSFLPVYAEELGLEKTAGYFFPVYALVLLLSRPFTGRWFDMYGANAIIYPSILCFAAGTLLLSAAETSLTLLLSAALIGLGFGTVFPSLQTIAIQVVKPERRAAATSTFLTFFDLGFGLGAFLFGYVASGIEIASLYLSGSLLVAFGVVVYYFLHGKKHGKKHGKRTPASRGISSAPESK